MASPPEVFTYTELIEIFRLLKYHEYKSETEFLPFGIIGSNGFITIRILTQKEISTLISQNLIKEIACNP